MSGTVTFASKSGVKLTVLLGETTPVISDGVSTWDTVARPKRDSIVRYTGRLPFRQSVPIVFDGYIDSESQEGDISKLVTMQSESHPVSVSGQALKTGLTWVIDGVDWDDQNTIWMSLKGRPHRVRQMAVVHLLEHIQDNVIQTPAAPSVNKDKKKPSKKVRTPAGMTAKQIAQIEFGNPDKWRKIYSDNPWLGPADPRRIIPKGTMLVILDGRIPAFTVP